jgi:hypothetical protein
MCRTSSPTPSCLLPKSEPLVVSICSSQDCLDTPRLPEDEVLIFQLGTAGLIYGGAAGVIRSPNPMIHSLSCGIHWFACGSAFWCMWRHPKLISLMSNLYLGTGLRSNIIKHHYQDKASPKERTYASALCGGIAGGSVTRLMGTISRTESTPCGIVSNQII